MLKSSFLSTTATARSAQTIKEAKVKQRIYKIADSLEASESKLLNLAGRADEGSRDAATGMDDMVIFTDSPDQETGGFSAVWSDDGHELSMERKLYSDRQDLQITKSDNKTTYRFRGNEPYYNTEYLEGLPKDANNLLLVKEEIEGAKEPQYTLIEGSLSLGLHSLSNMVGSLFTGMPNIKVEFKKG